MLILGNLDAVQIIVVEKPSLSASSSLERRRDNDGGDSEFLLFCLEKQHLERTHALAVALRCIGGVGKQLCVYPDMTTTSMTSSSR